MKNIKLIANSRVLVESFETEKEGLKYMKDHNEDFSLYYSHWELVSPDDKPIWKVEDKLISQNTFLKEREERAEKDKEEDDLKAERFYREHPEFTTGWGEEN